MILYEISFSSYADFVVIGEKMVWFVHNRCEALSRLSLLEECRSVSNMVKLGFKFAASECKLKILINKSCCTVLNRLVEN